MKIALIGPTNIDLISSVSGIEKEKIINSARLLGNLIAKYNHEIVVVPDRGVAVEGLISYKEANGVKAIAITPINKTEEQQQTVKCNENIHYCDEIHDQLDWTEQHSKICELSDLMVCCAISCGTISEMAWTKWVGKPKTYVCRDTITSLPPELLAEALIDFVDTATDFENILKKI